MKRPLATLMTMAAAAVFLVVLAEATQSRPEPIDPTSETELVLAVRTKGIAPAVAAAGLVAACRTTVRAYELSPPVAEGGGRFRVRIRPSPGPHVSRRLVGCFEDATLERTSAVVVARRDDA